MWSEQPQDAGVVGTYSGEVESPVPVNPPHHSMWAGRGWQATPSTLAGVYGALTGPLAPVAGRVGRGTVPAMTQLSRPVAVVAVTLLALAGAADAARADVPDDYDAVVDLTFPVAGDTHHYTNDFHAPRGGASRHHRATDIMAPHGTAVHAAVGGTVVFAPGQDDNPPSYGYMLRVAGDDGRDYRYIHLGRDSGPARDAYAAGIEPGATVERGDHIGYVGSSGNAHPDAPHLHFEILDEAADDPYDDEDDTTRRNPYLSLRDAEARGDRPGAAALPVPIDRLAGPDRIATAVAVADSHPDPQTALLARADDHADALAGAPLAADRDGVVLLTGRDTLDDRVADWLDTHDLTDVTLLGSDAALSPSVADAVAETTGQPPARLAGDDRYATAAKIAAELDSDTAYLVEGHHPDPARGWPDAVAVSALASAEAAPILLTAHNTLPDATRDALRGYDTVTAVGGTSAISDRVAEDAASDETTLERLAGDDRYGTSAAVADRHRSRHGDPSSIWLATGRAFPDALAAGPVAADGGILLLVDGAGDGNAPERATGQWLGAHGGDVNDLRIVGGTSAVSDTTAQHLAQLLDTAR